MYQEDWIKKLKVGDKVFLFSRGDIPAVLKVEKVFPSGIIEVGTSKYNPDGYLRGASKWDTTHIAAWSQNEADEYKVIREDRKNYRFLSAVNYKKMTPDQRQKVVDLVNSFEGGS